MTSEQINKNFELIYNKALSEFESNALLFKHKKTKAEIFYVNNSDQNKAFGVAFFTPQKNKTGLPHILEHMVLSGSKKYPVGSVVRELLKTSLANYINASTYIDKTVYSISSQNKIDFENLVNVYLDSVFNPLLTKSVFMREAWHYDIDEKEILKYTGTVYNEMKGVLSNTKRTLYVESIANLYPNSIYAHGIGGIPEEIIKLQHRDLVNYHKQFYHPSNAKFYLYGDLDINKYLNLIEEEISNYDFKDFSRYKLKEATNNKPKSTQIKYLNSLGNQNNIVSLSWSLPKLNQTEQLAFEILSFTLKESGASPLRKIISEKEFAGEMEGFGFINSIKYPLINLGFQGVKKENTHKISNAILEILKEPLDKDLIDAAFSRIEFILRDEENYGVHKNISLFSQSLSSWIYGGDPYTKLNFETDLIELRNMYSHDNKYFDKLVKKYLLQNKRCSELIMIGNVKIIENLDLEEQKTLQSQTKELDLEKLKRENIKFQKWLSTPESLNALATIPQLEKNDILENSEKYPYEILNIDGVKIIHTNLSTSGVIYFKLGFNVKNLPIELVPYLFIFAKLIIKLDTKNKMQSEITKIIDANSGKLDTSFYIDSKFRSEDLVSYFFFNTKTLPAKFEIILNLIKELVTQINFDVKSRVIDVIKNEERTAFESDIVKNTVAFGIKNSQSRVEYPSFLAESVNGITQFHFLDELLEEIDADWYQVLNKFERIREYIINKNVLTAFVTCSTEEIDIVRNAMQTFSRDLSVKKTIAIKKIEYDKYKFIAFSTHSQVNTNVLVSKLDHIDFKCMGALFVALEILNKGYLWESIRDKGNAYGARVIFDYVNSNIIFYSYRDPNIKSTIETYLNSSKHILDSQFSLKQIESAKIVTLKNIEKLKTANQKGEFNLRHYLQDVSDIDRNKIKLQVLQCSLEDIKNIGKLMGNISLENSAITIIGNSQKINEYVRDNKISLILKKI